MKTYTIHRYTAWGTDDYVVDVLYRGIVLQSFSGPHAAERALRYVARNGGRAVINMGDK